MTTKTSAFAIIAISAMVIVASITIYFGETSNWTDWFVVVSGIIALVVTIVTTIFDRSK